MEENEELDGEQLNNESNDSIEPTDHNDDKIITLSGMYENWFLDYASYVILERAVPALMDGFKPVQRRIMHSMKEMDDGRYNKVANIIGNTMKYHPHGDASIGDALVHLGQKDLLVDCQGNWGNTLTGDSAAAARYIEARLSKFASRVVFNAKTTHWLGSYDGRNKEPQHLPVKFPLLLAQGGEGIAVGMACKMMPHNFIELIDASIAVLKGRSFKIVPDFPNGGMADFSNYNDGLRGGKIRVRARIHKVDKKTLRIDEIPFGCTTTSLIDSVIKANDKGKIKIKKIEDNTAEFAEIIIHLPPGVSPDKMIDALYAFTDCEVSISPNAAVIDEKKPRFLGASEMLKISTNHTVNLLKWELEIKKAELEEQWHFASLEKIFIENRIYRRIEEEETWEGVIETIHVGLKPHIKHLKRKVTDDDVVRLTEIKIKRISKFDGFKADEIIARLEDALLDVQSKLDNLIDYAVDYFKELKDKFGEGRERKTEIKIFDNISAKKVIVSNKKFYVDKEEGFVGYNLKKAEYIQDCSEIDDVIIFFATGKLMVTKIADKKFVGKGIIHTAIWKKGDTRTIYHLVYQDGKGGPAMMKRFAVKSITRDKEYDLTKGTTGSKLLYFSAHPNGNREIVTVQLRPRPHLKKLRFEIDFGELLIKGRSSAGNRATKELISKIVQKEVGGSTLSATKIWFDEVVRRLNDDKRGKFIGEFKGNDKILILYKTGHYRLTNFDLSNHFDDDMIHLEKWHPERPISTVYFEPSKEIHYVKRFTCEVTTDKKVLFISEEENAYMDVVSTAQNPEIRISFNKHLKATKNLPDKMETLSELIDVKGLKTQGNQITKLKVKEITLEHPIEGTEPWPDDNPDNDGDDDSDDDNDDDVVTNTTAEEGVKVTPVKDEGPVEVEWDVDEKPSGSAIKDVDSGVDQPKLFDD
jgi:topoisomerase-4 subunit A